MKISREEYKQLFYLYNEAWWKFCQLSEYYNENKLDELIFPLFDWLFQKTGIEQDEDLNLIKDIIVYGHVPVNWTEQEDGTLTDIEYTSDLDEIYDWYFEE